VELPIRRPVIAGFIPIQKGKLKGAILKTTPSGLIVDLKFYLPSS